ncbi:MAG: penicillin-binding protein 2 [Synergistaceae bacterium]
MEYKVMMLRNVAIITLVLLSLGLIYFQILKGNEYVKLASNNRLRIIRSVPQRGIIKDTYGAPLALNVRVFNIESYPLNLYNEEITRKISMLLQRNGIPMTEEIIKEKIEKQYSAPYRSVTLATNLTFSQVANLTMDRDFDENLLVTPIWRRTYPAAEYTTHVVGYVSEITKDELENVDKERYRGGDDIGKNGIEANYEKDLHGYAGERVIEVDSRGRRLRAVESIQPRRGKDIDLEIDLTAQRYAAELITPFRGTIIAMDVRTGGVRCLYSSPSYDPNPMTWGISKKEWLVLSDRLERPMMNRAISGGYPPASTFKLITATCGLENNTITERNTVFCPGVYELGNRKFRCWKRSGHGTENVVTALKDSCDVFFYQTANKLGIDKLIKTADKYGVGRKTGIDIPGEIAGTIAGPKWKKQRLKESWYGGDTVNYSIGQGYLLLTPLQVLRAYGAVANGGKLYTPRLNKGIEPTYEILDVDPKVVSIVKKGLEAVTSVGTGRRANLYGVKLAGKTGTAQNAHGDDHAWFVGYAPVDNPQYVVVAIAEAGKAGSSVTGPMVGKMLRYLVTGEKYKEQSQPKEKQEN